MVTQEQNKTRRINSEEVFFGPVKIKFNRFSILLKERKNENKQRHKNR